MYEKPSYRVMKALDLGDEVFYTLADEGLENITIDVEYDKDGFLWLTIDGTYKIADWWYHPSWPGKIWKRIKLSLQILFTGYAEAQGEFLVLGKEHIDSIINFLQGLKERKHNK